MSGDGGIDGFDIWKGEARGLLQGGASRATTTFLAALAVSRAALADYHDASLSVVRSHRFGDGDVAYDSWFDAIGWALAVGDFNGDGLYDLAVGIPFEECENFTEERCGGAVIHYGQAGKGLANALLTARIGQFAAGSADPAEDSDAFEFALAVCDLNGDLYDDLAIGVPAESLVVGGNPVFQAGLVEIYYGGVAGSQRSRARGCANGAARVSRICRRPARFGSALAGRVKVFPGSLTGVGSAYQVLDQTLLGGGDPGAELEQFGYALAAGDFDGEGDTDLAIGVPFESDSQGPAIHFVDGGPGGMVNGSYLLQVFNLHSSLVGLEFGSALAAGDFDGEGAADLAVGAPNEYNATGAVTILRGSLFSDGSESQNLNAWSSHLL